ncbi:MAG: hypothetical protein OMM_10939 [Candidatus Magnetoglobus multicellularis str. Araruama]|uniref:Uncharacterized protein n=1 Tax=Candidatus Magnetoglobus multicellularis str. Araruama TaxID=890399 RepID=A0A1V1NZI7_9BACT|nr:MAG: hypothetical protein OMM_10939 [Candidatus Magnetoglobus multicellularis str. Araruama]
MEVRMSKPIEFLIKNKKEILFVHDQNNDVTQKTWDALITEKTILPRLDLVMKFNTFKQYLKLLILVEKDLNKQKNDELSKLRQEISKKNDELITFQAELLKVKKEIPNLRQKSKNIDGWTVRLTSKGYYNLCKSFNGKVESIYIGKTLDEQKVRLKIKEKMSNLR